MAAPESTALQINYKLPDGTLVNVYAKDQAHLEALLTSVSDLSTLILATATQLGANTSICRQDCQYERTTWCCGNRCR